MFSGGSVKVIGGVCVLCAVVFLMIGRMFLNEAETRNGGLFMVGMGAVFAVIAAACLIEKGRAITGRITAAIGLLICLGLIFGAVRTMFEGGTKLNVDVGNETTLQVRSQPIGMIVICVMIGLGSAYYTVHGKFPSEWTFEELFRWPSSPVRKSKPKSKSAATRKAKKPLRPLDE